MLPFFCRALLLFAPVRSNMLKLQCLGLMGQDQYILENWVPVELVPALDDPVRPGQDFCMRL